MFLYAVLYGKIIQNSIYGGVSLSSLYNGPSDGVDGVVNGYVDYAEEIIIRRAIPDLRDGQKRVTRRILYSADKHKTGYLRKCIPVVGDATALHPHGDGSVYGALCLMTDENGSCNVPLFHGMGNLGKSYGVKPAAMRYPKVMINDYALNDLFKDKIAMDLVQSEEGDGEEPKVLNAVYPIVLVNGASGIAVATGTRMPSFNLIDVLNLTIKYVKTKDLSYEDIIIPDFPTGGVLVCDKKEITKIVLTGKGKLKIRAKVEIVGSEIQVKELPYGKSVVGVVKAINERKGEINGLVSAIQTMGRDSDALLTITCRSKRVVEDVLLKLYQSNILQNFFSSNILVINDDKPEILGVHGIIERWYTWRCKVLEKKFNLLINGIQEEKLRIKWFIDIVNNPELKENFVLTMARKGKKAAVELLLDTYPDIPNEVINWITGISITSFHTGGSYATRYQNLCDNEEEWKNNLADLDSYIIDELSQLVVERQKDFPRKMEVSYKDYKFSKISESTEIEDDSYCVYTLKKDGFLSKTRSFVSGGNLFEIEAYANSVLIGFDNYGRLLRVIGKEIPFTGYDESGVYLPKYFGAEDIPEEFDYKILYLCLLDGSKKTLVYRDGYIGFFDTSEYLGKKNIRVVSTGVCPAVNDKLLHVFEEDETPDMLMLADDSRDKLKIGIVILEDVPERSRTSRAKVLQGTNINTKYLKGFNWLDLAKCMNDPDSYVGKLKIFKGQFYGDVELEDGFYLDICKDIE